MTESEFNSKYSCFIEDFIKYSETAFENLTTPNSLSEAMKYSFFAGGKRVRPVLMLAFGETLVVDKNKLLPFAFGLECIHTYSLIHDDLPCMDNDVLRRGKPTCHIRYGEAVALLAGDGLLNFAFEHILGEITDKKEIEALKFLAECSGGRGMVSGQASDKENEGKNEITEKRLLETYDLKTGKLLTAPFVIPAILKGDNAIVKTAEEIGGYFGKAFQFADDLKDVDLTSEETGKTSGKDEREGKFTSVFFYGKDNVKTEIKKLTDKCVDLLDNFDCPDFLKHIVNSVNR